MADTKVAAFTIDSEKAEQAVQRMNKLMLLLNKTAEDARKELSQIFVDVHGQMNAPLDQNKKKIDESAKSIKEYRAEQRMQNYLFREGNQSIMALVFAYSYLQQGQEKASGSGKKVADALVTGFMAANATEFAFFTLGQAGEKMGGKVGGALAKIGKYGGEIGLLVGVIVAARQAFEELMRTTDRYAEARQRVFLGDVPVMSTQALLGVQSSLQKQIKAIVDSSPLKSMGKALLAGDFVGFSMAFENEQKLYQLREKEKAIGDEILARNEKTKSTMVAMNQEIANAVWMRDHEAKTVEAVAYWNNEVVRLERERSRFLKTPEDIQKAETGLKLALKEAEASNVANEFDKQRFEANVERDKKFAEIEEKRKNAIRDGMNEVKVNDIAQKLRREADAAADQKVLKSVYDEELNLAQLKAENLDAERQKIDARYAAEEEYLRKQIELGIYKPAEGEERLFELRKRHELELSELQVKTLGELGQGFQSIEQGLAGLGARADSTLSRMIQMAQVALRIAQLVSKINSPGGGSSGDYMSVIGNVLSFAALFDTGGWTGPGPRNQVKGLVHSDEIVFEQPIVKRYRNELMSLRKSLQMGVPMPAAFPSSDNGGLGTAILVSEIRSLKDAIRSMPIEIKPVFKNILDTQKIIREEMPGYEQYRTNKQIDR